MEAVEGEAAMAVGVAAEEAGAVEAVEAAGAAEAVGVVEVARGAGDA